MAITAGPKHPVLEGCCQHCSGQTWGKWPLLISCSLLAAHTPQQLWKEGTGAQQKVNSLLFGATIPRPHCSAVQGSQGPADGNHSEPSSQPSLPPRLLHHPEIPSKKSNRPEKKKQQTKKPHSTLKGREQSSGRASTGVKGPACQGISEEMNK